MFQTIRTLLNNPKNKVMDLDVTLFQRNLLKESSNWLKQVEAKAKQLKKGKVILVAIIVDE